MLPTEYSYMLTSSLQLLDISAYSQRYWEYEFITLEFEHKLNT